MEDGFPIKENQTQPILTQQTWPIMARNSKSLTWSLILILDINIILPEYRKRLTSIVCSEFYNWTTQWMSREPMILSAFGNYREGGSCISFYWQRSAIYQYGNNMVSENPKVN